MNSNRYRKEILITIRLAHYFGSAFDRDQVWRLLRVPMARERFQSELQQLISMGIIRESNRRLYRENLEAIFHQRRTWSRTRFYQHKKALFWLAKLPWIRFLGLTGANAFESCHQDDDIDLFVVTVKGRLWLCYLLIVIFCKLMGKRRIFCVNYLIDENNLQIRHRNYYTAVQLMHMIPVIDNELNEKLMQSNGWVKNYLPNARPCLLQNSFYRLPIFWRNGNRNDDGMDSRNLLTRLNRFVYRKYFFHLYKKYAPAFGKGIVLTEGIAKLNRNENQDMYARIFQELEEVELS